MAHALRGYYAAMNKAAPAITHVLANYDILDNPAPYQAYEIQRIADFATQHSLEHAIVLDQYTPRGRVLSYATALLCSAGIQWDDINQIAGKWYVNVEPKQGERELTALAFMDTDPQQDRLADWLQQIGTTAA